MKSAGRWLIPLALIVTPLLVTRNAVAQSSEESGHWNSRSASQPVTFAFVLRQAGEIAIDPAAATGRREVLQLMASRSSARGQFRRSRIDHLGTDDMSSEGWYEIRGNAIQLYYRDADGGATGRVDVGRYLESMICLSDHENGEVLAFEYLAPVKSEEGSTAQIVDPAESKDPAEFVGSSQARPESGGC